MFSVKGGAAASKGVLAGDKILKVRLLKYIS